MKISPWQYFFLISLLLFVIHVFQARVSVHYTTDVIHTSRDQHVRSEAHRSLLHAVYKVLIRLAQGARPRLRGWNKHQAERAIWCYGASSAHCVCRTQCCRPYVCTTVGWMTHYGLNAKIIFSLISLHQWEREKKQPWNCFYETNFYITDRKYIYLSYTNSLHHVPSSMISSGKCAAVCSMYTLN